VNNLIGDARLEQIVEDFSRWFFSVADRVVVTDARYVDILEKRGYVKEKMVVLGKEPEIGEGISCKDRVKGGFPQSTPYPFGGVVW
jgi:hypothetical protein